MVLVVADHQAQSVVDAAAGRGEACLDIGRVIEADGGERVVYC